MAYNEVYVWGNNQHGQLGLGIISDQGDHHHGLSDDVPIEDLIPKICCFNTIVTKVCCGTDHSLLLSQSGHVYSMGSNQYG